MNEIISQNCPFDWNFAYTEWEHQPSTEHKRQAAANAYHLNGQSLQLEEIFKKYQQFLLDSSSKPKEKLQAAHLLQTLTKERESALYKEDVGLLRRSIDQFLNNQAGLGSMTDVERISEFAAFQIALLEMQQTQLLNSKNITRYEADSQQSFKEIKSIFASNLSTPLAIKNKMQKCLDSLKGDSNQYAYFTRVADQLLRLMRRENNGLELLNRCQVLIKASFSYDATKAQLIVKFDKQFKNSRLESFTADYLNDMELKTDLDSGEVTIDSLSNENFNAFAAYVLVQLEKSILSESSFPLSAKALANYIAYFENQRDENVHHFSNIIKEFPISNPLFIKKFISKPEIFAHTVIPFAETLELGDKWQNYIIRKPVGEAAWNRLYTSSSQEEYGRHMHHTVQVATRGLKEKIWDFKTLLSYLRLRRQFIAYKLHHPNASRVGRQRTKNMEGSTTHCVDEYSQITTRLKELLACPKKSQNLIKDQITSHVGKLEACYIYQEKMDGPPIDLSRTIIYDEPIFHSKLNTQSFGEIIHTLPENIENIMTFVQEDLYPKALAAQSLEELLEHLGRIFWWICQAKPWTLGDPSIAETLIRSILVLKGDKNPPWKMGIIPWIEVMVEPQVDEFAKIFHRLFEWPDQA